MTIWSLNSLLLVLSSSRKSSTKAKAYPACNNSHKQRQPFYPKHTRTQIHAHIVMHTHFFFKHLSVSVIRTIQNNDILVLISKLQGQHFTGRTGICSHLRLLEQRSDTL